MLHEGRLTLMYACNQNVKKQTLVVVERRKIVVQTALLDTAKPFDRVARVHVVPRLVGAQPVDVVEYIVVPELAIPIITSYICVHLSNKRVGRDRGTMSKDAPPEKRVEQHLNVGAIIMRPVLLERTISQEHEKVGHVVIDAQVSTRVRIDLTDRKDQIHPKISAQHVTNHQVVQGQNDRRAMRFQDGIDGQLQRVVSRVAHRESTQILKPVTTNNRTKCKPM